MPQKWTIISSQLVFDHPWYKLRQDVVKLPSGRIVDDYFVSVRAEVAMAVALTEDRQLILVRQYKHGAQKITIEIPAGTFDPAQETAAQAAQRELLEETGYAGAEAEHLVTLIDNPTKDTNSISIWLVQNCRQVAGQNLDPNEEIEVMLVPLPQARHMVLSGQIAVSGSVAGLLLAFERLAV